MTLKSGNMEVILNEPLFSSNSVWYPGYSEIKSFQVKNRGDKTRQVQIEALSENETKNLSQGLNLEVRNDTSCVYGCSEVKTLKNFFDVGTLNVGEVPVNDDGKVFDMEAMMPIMVGNEYQGGKVSFDLKIGLEGDAGSTVVVQDDGGAPTAMPTTASAVLGDANDANVRPTETLEITPTRTETQGEVKGMESGNLVGTNSNWWFNWWWLVLLLVLTAATWWWNRKRERKK